MITSCVTKKNRLEERKMKVITNSTVVKYLFWKILVMINVINNSSCCAIQKTIN